MGPVVAELPIATPWAAPARDESPVARELLDAVIAGIGDVDIAAPIYGYARAVRQVELRIPTTGAAPHGEKRSIARKFVDPLISIIGDVHVAGCIQGKTGRKKEAAGTVARCAPGSPKH